MGLPSVDQDSSLTIPRVMMVEDERAVGEALRRALEKAGMEVCWAMTGAEAVALKESFKPEIVLVDMELPDVNGVELIRWLVAAGSCGVIVVSGAGDDTDRIVGLELGADDYVAKPPLMRELIARIRAVHRRVTPSNAAAAPAAEEASLVKVGGIQIDHVKRVVSGPDGQRIALTGAEYAALEALARSQGKVLSRDEISRAALRRPWRPEDRSVDQLVLALRNKLGPNGVGHTVIESVRGSGYLLRIVP